MGSLRERHALADSSSVSQRSDRKFAHLEVLIPQSRTFDVSHTQNANRNILETALCTQNREILDDSRRADKMHSPVGFALALLAVELAAPLLRNFISMQLNLNSKIGTIRAFLTAQTHSSSRSPSGYFTEISRAFFGLCNGIFFEWSGAPDSAIDSTTREAKRLAYEMKQSLGIKGFVLNLTASSSFAAGLSACWDAARPCLEAPELEDAVAQLRAETSRFAEVWDDTTQKSSLRLNREEAAQLQVGLDFYHYLLPRMLVLTSGLRLACDQELLKRGGAEERIPEGFGVHPDGWCNLFQTIRGILGVAPVPGAARMARAWSGYLAVASAQLKPVVRGENFRRAAEQLHKISRQLAPGFQDRIGSVEVDNLEGIAYQLRKLEALLPSLIISITQLQLSFRPADLLASPTRSVKTSLARQSRNWRRSGPAKEGTFSRRPAPIPANQYLIAAKCLTSHQPQ